MLFVISIAKLENGSQNQGLSAHMWHVQFTKLNGSYPHKRRLLEGIHGKVWANMRGIKMCP